ncbi:MAG TPA: adenylate/guanylate cyclase domain-containing protein, partial [Verrucomicrobiae bacterium]
ALGDISTDRDPDGILRRVQAFHDVRHWHPLFVQLSEDPEIQVDLTAARILPGKIILPQKGTTNLIEVAVDAAGCFQLKDFLGDDLPKGMPPVAPAFTSQRLWHMGILLAAQELKLDLARSEVDLAHGRIVLHGPAGVERVLPVDGHGYFNIDWRISPTDVRIKRAPMERLLVQERLRAAGRTNGLPAEFRNCLVVVGSAAQGNDLTDHGATPLERDTLLVSKHWNVANSIIQGEFIRRTPLPVELLMIVVAGLLTAFITWQLRAVAASTAIFLLGLGYWLMAVFAFDHCHWWLPVVYPLGGAMLMLHFILMVHLVLFEEQDKRRVRSVFSKMVSPEVVNELLQAEKLSLGGSHREVTVFFADIRGFTALTDQMQEAVAQHIRTHQMDEAQGEKYFEESARETLETVNLYLATVAEAIKRNGGTLDKYIGDCVMAFWNAPVASPQHAVHAVRAAVDAQRAIHALNEQREAQNPARQLENQQRMAAGLPPRQLHSALHLGTGINTGMVTVGLMGSNDHGFNYTVFGREVNLASRLEGVSGSGRIIISDLTYFQLLRHAPELASHCIELFPEKVKGFKDAVRIYEVPWKEPAGK